MFEPFFPPGRLVYTKSNFLRSMSDEAIDALVQYVGKSPSPYTFAPFIEHWHGAATRVPVTDTAFPSSAVFVELLRLVDVGEPVRVGKEQAMDARMLGSAAAVSGRRARTAITSRRRRRASGEVSREAYGPNYDRLVALKNKYDPTTSSA